MLSARLVHFVVRASAQPLCPRRLYGFRLNLPKRRGAADAEAAQRHETEPAAPTRPLCGNGSALRRATF